MLNDLNLIDTCKLAKVYRSQVGRMTKKYTRNSYYTGTIRIAEEKMDSTNSDRNGRKQRWNEISAEVRGTMSTSHDGIF